MLTIICKFFKRIFLIFDKNIWFAKQWTTIFLAVVFDHDWNVLKTIIFDRNRKFMSTFWIDVFRRFDTKFLISIVYHSQTNEQSKRINQIVEITFRYWIINNFKIDFIQNLSYIQTDINNIVAANIEHISNEICYDFRFQNNLNLLSDMLVENWSIFRLQYRENVEKTIVWVNMIIKFNYDRRHTSIDLKKKFEIYLRLHHEYTISNIINRKLSNQRVDSFKILQKIDKLIYKFELFFVIIIHSVVSIIQLKSKFVDENFYRRARSDDERFFSIIMKNVDSNDSTSSYEIERLLKKRESRDKIQYFVKWKKYDNVDNV